MPNTLNLEGNVALVSGGARGIGAAIARALVDAGAKVVIGDVLEAEGEAAAEALGSSAVYVHLDVTQGFHWRAAVDTAVATWGKLDVLVNNAGISIPAPIETLTPEAWDKVVAVNLTGAFFGIQASVPAMRRAGGGSIINISSIAGLTALPFNSSYVATKFGVRGLTKAAALDLGRYGIRVNSVHPGFIQTPLTAAAQPDTSVVALGRGGKPDEIAKLVCFLASDASSFSTGGEFVADGGETAGNATGGSLSIAIAAAAPKVA